MRILISVLAMLVVGLLATQAKADPPVDVHSYSYCFSESLGPFETWVYTCSESGARSISWAEYDRLSRKRNSELKSCRRSDGSVYDRVTSCLNNEEITKSEFNRLKKFNRLKNVEKYCRNSNGTVFYTLLKTCGMATQITKTVYLRLKNKKNLFNLVSFLI